MKILFISIFMILLVGCEDYMKINSTLNDIQKLAKSKYNLETFGSGVAAPGIIKNFRMTFISKKQCDIADARKLLIDFTEDYINLLNKNAELKQYIEKLPIDEKHAFFIISFKNQIGIQCEELAAIVLGNGNVEYCRNNPNTNSLDEIFKETYSEAYFKVYGIYPPKRN